MQNGWRQLDNTNPQVNELSRLLGTLPLHPENSRQPTFRNASGVARKTADIATAHPEYIGTPTHGNALDRVILASFLARPAEMHARAEAIRAAASQGALTQLSAAVADEDDVAASEGRLLMRRHVARERDPKLRSRKIAAAVSAGQSLKCEVCRFDFEQFYGDRGRGFIECHHVIPLHTAGPRQNRLQDLALLCANCHRMIHRPPWLRPGDLRILIQVDSRRDSNVVTH